MTDHSLRSPSHDPTLLRLNFLMCEHTFYSFSDPLHILFPFLIYSFPDSPPSLLLPNLWVSPLGSLPSPLVMGLPPLLFPFSSFFSYILLVKFNNKL